MARLSSAIARARRFGATLREPHRTRTLSHCYTSARACGMSVGRARSLRSLACARFARVLAVWPYGFRPTARPRARHVSTATPPHRMPQVTTAPPPSLRIFRFRPQAVMKLHVLSSGGSPFRQMLLVTTAYLPRLPHVSPTEIFRPGRASALPRLGTAPLRAVASFYGIASFPCPKKNLSLCLAVREPRRLRQTQA